MPCSVKVSIEGNIAESHHHAHGVNLFTEELQKFYLPDETLAAVEAIINENYLFVGERTLDHPLQAVLFARLPYVETVEVDAVRFCRKHDASTTSAIAAVSRPADLERKQRLQLAPIELRDVFQ